MTDLDVLYRAVLDRPDDDTPRLVLADALDDAGTPDAADRAALIRAQCERDELILRWVWFECGSHSDEVPAANAVRHRELTQQTKGLLGRHAAVRQWLGPLGELAPFAGDKGYGWQLAPDGAVWAGFERGFVGFVSCPAADWVAHGDAILAAHPVRRVRLSTTPAVYPLMPVGASGHFWRFDGDPAGKSIPLRDVDERRARIGEFAEARDGSVGTPLGEHTPFVRELCRLRWPGVAFELPPPDAAYYTRRILGEPLAMSNRDLAAMTERQIAAILDPPPTA